MNKYPKKDEKPEGDMWKLAKIEAHLNGNKCEIKEQTKIAIENIKNVEMRKNVFEDRLIEYWYKLDNLENTVKQHGEKLINHENRIQKLENTVDLHSM